MKFNDATLMLLNVSGGTKLVEKTLRSALISCFIAINHIENRWNKPNDKMVVFARNALETVANSAAKKALQSMPESVRDVVEPLEQIDEKFEEIMMALGGGTYRDHRRHSQRVFWLGVLLSSIMKNWGMDKNEFEDFESSWYLTARFHDFCYILQNMEDMVKNTDKEIRTAFPSMNFSMDVDINFGSYVMIHKHLESLRYISKHNSDSFLTNISFLEQLEIRRHNILSALFIVDLLRKENIVPKLLSEGELKKIARAIALHGDSLTQAPLRPGKDFLGALLILSDEIQEWGRPTYEKNSPIIEEITLDGLKVNLQANKRIRDFVDHLLNGSCQWKLPKLNFNIKEKFKNYLVVKRKNGEEFRITLLIEISNDSEFVKAMEKIGESQARNQEILEHARVRAKTVISNLSSYATSIGLEALQIEPDAIISSRSKKSIRLEIPLVMKARLFPIYAENSLLAAILSYILSILSPGISTNLPKLSFEEESKKSVRFKIPNLSSSNIASKRRNLYRLNAFNWDWKAQIVSDTIIDGTEQYIFPIKNIKDL